MAFRDYSVSGDLPLDTSNNAGGWGSLRTYSTFRYHGGGAAYLTVDTRRNDPCCGSAMVHGVRLALHNGSRTQVGVTAAWGSNESGQRSLGNPSKGNYAMWGRAVKYTFTAYPGLIWSGTLHLQN